MSIVLAAVVVGLFVDKDLYEDVIEMAVVVAVVNDEGSRMFLVR